MTKKTSEQIEKNPEKVKAYRLSYYYIDIPKNQLCEICNKEKAVHKHHEDYFQPLNIIFLCLKCHIKLHKDRRLQLMILQSH